jgi:alkylation response protein AidB-like acyl-CoA dehydrogenase
MDFTLSETQRELAALVRQIVTDQATPTRLAEVEATGVRFDRTLWAALGSAGVLAAAAPASIGGGGLDLLEQCSVLIELGRAVAPVPYLTSVATSAAAIGYFGTEAQRDRWAAPAVAGDRILAAALSEDLSDDPEAPSTTAERTSGGWVLNGTKAVVSAGTVADAFLVGASTIEGNAIFVVPRDAPGVSIEAERAIDGDAVATVTLANVALGDDAYVGDADVLHWVVARSTILLCAYQLGVLERALELTAAYATERKQFGRPIGSFQAVAQRLADAYIDVEAVRLTMWEAAWRAATPLQCPTEIATAKFWAADAGHRVAHTAVHVHGGTGIDMDGVAHRYFVAAKRTEFALGGATAQLRKIGAELAATPA